MIVDHYTYRVTWSPEDREHVCLCAEFASLSWLAHTPEAALKGIRRVVSEAVADMDTSGETKPTPLADKHYSGEFRVRIPPQVHRALALQAAEKGGQLESTGERETCGLSRPFNGQSIFSIAEFQFVTSVEKIPRAMAEKFAAITGLTDAFCETHLSDEYRVLIHRVIGSLARKRPSPLLRGKESTWATAVAHAVGVR